MSWDNQSAEKRDKQETFKNISIDLSWFHIMCFLFTCILTQPFLMEPTSP